jgi:ribose transport system substrate-binding protein
MNTKRVIAIIVTLLMALTLFTACSQPKAEETASAAPSAAESASAAPETSAAASESASTEAGAPKGAGGYQYSLGVIQPGPEAYYQNYADSVTAAAEYAGMTVTTLLSQYSAQTEIANVEDLISQGVDAIACFSTASDIAQIDAQKCNEADIPLFLMSSAAAEGEGKPTSTVGNSFYDMGKMNGDWAIANFKEAENILEIQGQLGQGIAEEISRGFADGIASRSDLKVVSQKTANWKRDEAISITEDALASGLDFSVIFVHNEDMCAGVINVLKENNMLDKIKVITQNGSDPGIEMIKAGEVLATTANPPSFVGGDVVVQILKYFDGQEIPESYNSPVFVIDSTNVNDADLVTWDKKWAISRVDAYFAGEAE